MPQRPGDPVRVLVLSHFGGAGGAEIALARLLGAMDRRRFSITLAVLGDGGELGQQAARLGVKVLTLPEPGSVLALSKSSGPLQVLRPGVAGEMTDLIRRHAHLVRSIQPDVIWANTLKALLYGGIAGRRTGVPVLWYMHEYLAEPYFSRRHRWALTRAGKGLADMVAANSEATRQSLLRAGLPSDRVVTVYPPMLPDQDDPAGGADAHAFSLREELGLADRPLVTVIGRLSRGKGQLVFLRAADELLRRRNDVSFLVVGEAVFGSEDDSYAREVESFMRGMRPGRIHLLPFQRDIRRVLLASTIVVFPSIWPEGLGLSVADAMMLKRPVIATGLGGTGELVTADTGLVVQAGAVEELAAAIEGLLDDPAGREALAERGHAHASGLLGEHNVRRLESVLAALADRRR